MPDIYNLIFIAGCGDIGGRVARIWLAKKRDVYGLVRSDKHAEALQDSGIRTVMADLDVPESLTNLDVHKALIYYFAPPPSRGISDTRISNLITAMQDNVPQRIIYISTSGVYGDCHGAWVTEEEAVKPSADRSHRRLDAEQQLKNYCTRVDAELVILRVPGIYGCDRLPIARIKQGRSVVKDHDSFTNRIHEDDLARICVAAGEKNKPATIYNVSDGQPGTMAQYFTETARALNLPLPPEISWQEAQRVMSPEMLSYLSESRRIDNTKMLEELGVKLLYPDLQAGLAACVQSLNPKD